MDVSYSAGLDHYDGADAEAKWAELMTAQGEEPSKNKNLQMARFQGLPMSKMGLKSTN